MELKLDQARKLAKKKIKEGSPSEARLIYQNILAKFPGTKNAKIGLKALLITSPTDKIPEDRNPTPSQLHLLIDLYNQRNLQKALSNAIELLKAFPHSEILHNICGAIHAGLKGHDTAIQSYKLALNFKPNYAEAYNNMGNSQMVMKK